MSRSLLDLNQFSEAEAQQVEALRLVQRSNPPDSDAVLAAIYKYAEWLGDRLLFQLQRDQYTRALRSSASHMATATSGWFHRSSASATRIVKNATRRAWASRLWRTR